MTVRTLHIATLVACLALATWVFWPKPRQAPTAPFDPLSAIPGSATLVVAVDLVEARRLGLARRLWGSAPLGSDADGLTASCGFDPTDSVHRLILAVVPSVKDPTGFGVAAESATKADALIECAVTTIRRGGGRPVVTPVGSFVTVRDDSRPDGAEIAAREPGPTLVASSSLLRRMMDAADGRLGSVLGNERHRALRSRVDPSGLLVASWIKVGSDPDLEVLPIMPEGVAGAAVSVSIADAVKIVVVLDTKDEALAKELARRLEPEVEKLGTRIHARSIVRSEGASAVARIELSHEAALTALASAERWLADRSGQ